MNALTRDLRKLVEKTEKEAAHYDRFRQKFHLMPPVGWLNDPNGLCEFKGEFHSFFQYSPFDEEGGLKFWGHYISKDMIHWTYKGVALYPDQPFDCHGVYSGSAFIEDGKMYLYYTGNVKLEDGDFDYIRTGREANTVLVMSEDGRYFSQKKELMRNRDYPSDVTCHVRDPKVWKEKDRYYMVQGARTEKDEGQVLLFESEDKLNWKLKNRISTKEKFGYMWECPDYFEIDGIKLLSASVQGLEGEEWKDRNVYQSGYFFLNGDVKGECQLSSYFLWDYGFDYYAPQTFETDDGRRIQIAWMGMPDCPEYTNHTIKDGWQHCFTFPREISVKNGRVLQNPVRELETVRKNREEAEGIFHKSNGTKTYEIFAEKIKDNHFYAVLGEELVLEYRDGEFEMCFRDQKKESVSAGRKSRRCTVKELLNVRILADVSSVEVFLNDGEQVFSTRYYPEKYSARVEAPDAKITFWEL